MGHRVPQPCSGALGADPWPGPIRHAKQKPSDKAAARTTSTLAGSIEHDPVPSTTEGHTCSISQNPQRHVGPGALVWMPSAAQKGALGHTADHHLRIVTQVCLIPAPKASPLHVKTAASSPTMHLCTPFLLTSPHNALGKLRVFCFCFLFLVTKTKKKKRKRKINRLPAEDWEGNGCFGRRRKGWEPKNTGQGTGTGEWGWGFGGKRILAKSHAEGPRCGADLYVSRLRHWVTDRDKKGYPSPTENPRPNSTLATPPLL